MRTVWKTFIAATAFFLQAYAAESVQYRQLTVAGRLNITVPAHWHVRDANGRRNIAASAEAALDPQGKSAEAMHVSSLSVVSSVEKPQVILRVSVVDEPGSQEELLNELKRGKTAAIAELAEAWKQEVPRMQQATARQGGRYLGGERFDFVQLGGKTAMLVSYRRASLTGGAPFRVNQYHLPMGQDKLLVTMSVQESAATLMTPIVDRIRNSISVSK
ncbi:MAG: hypothetical protein J0L57_14965 [Burkholderiales bacterium]|nr:hypothetical protein [Burkholderiales bacterium]